MKKIILFLLLSVQLFAQTGKPQAIDNMATPLFKGILIRKQSLIPTPALGIQIGNTGGRVVSKDSLGVVTQYATSTELATKQNQLSGTGFVKATGTTISYDNSTYLSTSSAASTYLPINNPTATGTLTAPTITNTLGANFATTSGNVGIGTASPSEKLHLVGSFLQTGTGFARFNSSAFGFTPSVTGISVGYNLSGGVGESNLIWGTGGAAFPFRIQSYDGTNVVNRLAISTAGNVGIGTTVPSEKFQVDVPNIANTKLLKFSTNNNANNYGDISVQSGELRYSSPFGIGIAPNNTVSTFFATSGNVGIGTGASAPQKRLHIKGTEVGISTYQQIIESPQSAYGAGLSFQSPIGGSGVLTEMARITADGESVWNETLSTQNAGLRFFTMNQGVFSEKARISSTGNVGIGTFSPNAQLQLSNSVVNRKIVLYEDANNDHQFFGLGLSSGVLRYQVGTTGGSHIFYSGVNSATSQELFRINGNQTVTYTSLTTAQINALPSPVQGTVAYNSTIGALCFYDGTSWKRLSHSAM